MVVSSKPPANGFVAAARKVYNPIGFAKGYNFVLWFVCLGAFCGFTLARLPYLDFWGTFCGGDGALPGECFYYLKPGRYQIGIILHLGCILPASLLACLQFVPVIRHKVIIVHRINGYLVVLLALVGTVAALVIADRAMGGSVESQTAIGLLGIMFTGSIFLSYINIKRLQIEQHRAWMLRAWVYGGIIITARLIMIITANILPSIRDFYGVRPCDQVHDILGSEDRTKSLYPECAAFFSGGKPDQHAMILAKYGNGANPVEISQMMAIGFSMGLWLSLAIHAIGVETYLYLTPAEHERLRNVSYQRQLEAGMKHPGKAGITADRIGDAGEWIPLTQKHDSITPSS